MKINVADLHEQIIMTVENNNWLTKSAGPMLKEFCHQFRSRNFVILLTDLLSRVLAIEKSNDSEKTDALIRHVKYNLQAVKTNESIDIQVANLNKHDSFGNELISDEFGQICINSHDVSSNSENHAFITIVAYKEEMCDEFNAFISIISKTIGSLAEMNRKTKELEKQNNFRGLLIDASSEGMLSVDMNGIITFINPAGMRILKIEKNIIGKHITEGVDFEPTILNVLKTQKGYVDKEFRLKSKRGTIHFVKTAIILRNDNGEMVGVLDIFRNIKEVTSMVNRMMGAQAKYSIFNIIGESPQIQEIRRMIKLTGSNEKPVLIEGESGTGKDIIAQAIHNYSTRSGGPFVIVDCESLPRNLLESELFGYEEGSFSKQHSGGRPGKMELANGGTLFLNNVGFIPLDLQSKLCHALLNKCVVRIGGFNEIPIDVRIISTSGIDLKEMTVENNFREDLYGVLSTVCLKTSPLRDRDKDIDIIANQTLNQYNLINGTCRKFSEEARTLLHNWSWPGNVRELESVVEHAYYLSEGEWILPEHLHSKITRISTKMKENHVMSIKEAETMAVMKALEHTGGNVTQAAKILGIGRNTLYGKMKEYNL
ncbi:MAG: sigma 54-interacting transcriptional regulator [Sedimentibacter sp.]|uniref:sigma-54 interaction domain-containing protein n=1 Tax=Sedimentibacter sp. TaxID=1960295 RepID=UPI003157F49B